ncbi:hypothetical protein EMCRGX_G028664 [Ephydatia muelleri]
MVINQDDQALAGKLVDIYLTFFKHILAQQRQLDAKVLAAILTGINRAFPFVKGEIPSLEDHLHTLFKVVHVGPVATGIQSLMLLYQIMESKQAVSGRYYQALYTKLQDPALRNLSGQGLGTRLPYDGVTGSWPEWEAHFENVAAVNKWESEEEKLMWLRVRLTRKAQTAFMRYCVLRLFWHLRC